MRLRFVIGGAGKSVAVIGVFRVQVEGDVDGCGIGQAQWTGRREGGGGDGPVAPFFKLSPPDLTRIARRHGGEFPTEQVRKIIDGREVRAPHGTREMPVWGLEFYFANPDNPLRAKEADVLVGKLVEYLRSVQQ